MASTEFTVRVSSGFSNPDAKNLSETEKSVAGAMGLTEDEFRRSKIEYLAKEDRARARGYELGKAVGEIVRELGPDYRVVSVTRNTETLTWTVEVSTGSGTSNVVLPWELVDDVLDSHTQGELQRLRNMVLFALERRDLIFKKR